MTLLTVNNISQLVSNSPVAAPTPKTATPHQKVLNTQLNSSCLRWAIYMSSLEGENLYVEFNSGRKYLYSGVPEELYHDLIHSESVGKFYNAFIKGKFECAEVD